MVGGVPAESSECGERWRSFPVRPHRALGSDPSDEAHHAFLVDTDPRRVTANFAKPVAREAGSAGQQNRGAWHVVRSLKWRVRTARTSLHYTPRRRGMFSTQMTLRLTSENA